MTENQQEMQPIMAHLVELRTRFLRALICIVVLFCLLLYFSNDIYEMVARPLVQVLPANSHMIATNVTAPFFTPIKLTIFVAIFLSIPYLLFELWGFIAPALYKNEKRLILPLVFSSTILFYVGLAFAYFVVFPLAFYFFVHTAPDNVVISTDISQYLDFVMTIFLVFGIAFEVPVAIILLCWAGITTPESLKKKRPYMIVAMFAIAMLVTPPDVFSQILLAVPMCLLFELGVFCARFYKARSHDEAAEENNDEID